MLVDLGVPLVLLGHSERRNVFGESIALVGEKVKAALAAGAVLACIHTLALPSSLALGLRVVVCCGELLTEREAGKTLDVVKAQLEPLLTLSPEEWERVIIACAPARLSLPPRASQCC